MPVPVCRTVQEAYDAGRADTLAAPAAGPELAAMVAELIRPWLEQIAAQDRKLLTVAQAAEQLGITRRYLYDLISAGEITTVRLPSKTGGQGKHRIEQAEISAFVERNRAPRRPAGEQLCVCPYGRARVVGAHR